MMDFQTTCHFPGLCEACHGLITMNALDRAPTCPECAAADPIPYDDPRLVAGPGANVVESRGTPGEDGRALVLTDGTYRRPACGEPTLTFAASGRCWD